jgi:hypothetical protein
MQKRLKFIAAVLVCLSIIAVVVFLNSGRWASDSTPILPPDGGSTAKTRPVAGADPIRVDSPKKLSVSEPSMVVEIEPKTIGDRKRYYFDSATNYLNRDTWPKNLTAYDEGFLRELVYHHRQILNSRIAEKMAVKIEAGKITGVFRLDDKVSAELRESYDRELVGHDGGVLKARLVESGFEKKLNLTMLDWGSYATVLTVESADEAQVKIETVSDRYIRGAVNSSYPREIFFSVYGSVAEKLLGAKK